VQEHICEEVHPTSINQPDNDSSRINRHYQPSYQRADEEESDQWEERQQRPSVCRPAEDDRGRRNQEYEGAGLDLKSVVGLSDERCGKQNCGNDNRCRGADRSHRQGSREDDDDPVRL